MQFGPNFAAAKDSLSVAHLLAGFTHHDGAHRCSALGAQVGEWPDQVVSGPQASIPFCGRV